MDSLSNFQKIEKIGQGTFGTVCKTYLDKSIFIPTGEVFALKYIKKDNKGIEINAYREIEILHYLEHPSIVKLVSILPTPKGIYLILEYGGFDLAYHFDILKVVFTESQIKLLMKELLKVLTFMHQKNVIHRDLKLSNILVNESFQLKLCDFGLSRSLSNIMTSGVATLWYRAPELLFGEKQYGPASDMWSFGCIYAEMLNKGRPLMPGKNPLGQLELICSLIGPPSVEIWPEFSRHSDFVPPDRSYNTLQVKFFRYGQSCIDFLNEILVWDPSERLTAAEALLSSYIIS